MKKIVITFGRMNPSTTGHQKLADKLQSVAKQNKSEARIYLSHTQNNKKDPLDYSEKIKYAKTAFGKIVTKSNARTIIEVAKELEQQGYTDLIVVVGSDRIPEFKRLLEKYNGKDYNFNSIEVISAGERDPDADDVSGMSASKVRKFAIEGDYDKFVSGMPSKLSEKDKKDIYDKIRSIIKEETEFDEERKPLSLQQRLARGRMLKRIAPKLARLRAIRRKRMADEPTLKKRARKLAIQFLRKRAAGERGAEYTKLTPSEKITIDKLITKKLPMVTKMAQRLLPKVRKSEMERVKKAREGVKEQIEEQRVPQDQDIKGREGTQPKKYFSGLNKDIKARRDAQFKSGAEKDSGDPSAYPDKHAGDAGVETKPSKHTLKYKKIFGEQSKQIDLVRAEINREKESDKIKFDRMRARARVTDVLNKNRQTEEFDISESAEAALRKKSEKSGVPYGILKKVYDRGMAAWRTGHRPGATQQQWAFARVNSYITKGKGTYYGADADLREEETVEEYGAGEEGTHKLVKKYLKDTPMAKIVKNESQQEELSFSKSLSTVLYKKNYALAKDALKKIVDKENNRTKDLLYYAQRISKSYPGVDAKKLAGMMEERDSCCDDCEKHFDHIVEETEYQGRKVKLNDPFRTPDGPKKFSVYVKNDKGNVVKVNFGDPNMEIKRDDPDRRRNFRARHGCDNPGPKWKARYWSCYQWRAGAKVEN